MNYTYLNVFYTVAKLQNISKAAAELGVTQPAVSRIIANIEREHNTKLFLRSKTGVTLTREGIQLFEMIKNRLIELEKISDNIASKRELGDVVIHIGATSTALYCYLFKSLENIKKEFPNVNFRIYSNSSANLLNMVSKGILDFAFITTPFNGGDDLEVYKISKLNDILIAPISMKNEIKSPLSFKSLAKHPFILLSKDMQYRQFIDDFLAKHSIHINPVYETDSSAILPPFVELGYGLTFIPDEMAKKSIEEGKCYKVDIFEKLPNRYIAFVIKKDKNYSNIIYEIKQAILKENK